MSFGINGPDRTPAIQKSHHANDGGAGNLGYFQQQKKEEEKNEADVFELSSEEEDKENPLLVELDSLGSKIKNFWFKLNKSFVEKKSEEQ